VARYEVGCARLPLRSCPVVGNYDLPEGLIPLLERLAQRLIRTGWGRRLAQAKPKLGGAEILRRQGIRRVTEAMRQVTERAYAEASRNCSAWKRPGKARKDGPMESR